MKIYKDNRDVYVCTFCFDIDKKEISLTLEVTEEYFRFNVFKRQHYQDNEIKEWFAVEIENITKLDKMKIVSHGKWLYNYSTKGVAKVSLK